jgi:peptidoglycan/LPS O-acetylase OafA/YrhL
MRTIAAAAARDGDNFIGLRHVAALMVLWAHSWSYLDRATEPLARALAGFDSGRFGVYLFFAISGFLITLALCRNDALPRYAWHRALRVYPAYAACLLVSVFAIGATFTTLPLSDYLAHPRTWSYFTSNGMLISLQWDLPGVFVDQPLSGLVNGSLWSLGAEIRWYSLFGVLALFGLFRHRRLFTVVAALLIADSLRRHGWPLAHLTTSPAITQLFLLGALAALWRDVVPLSARVLVPLWLVAIGCVQTRFGASLPSWPASSGALCRLCAAGTGCRSSTIPRPVPVRRAVQQSLIAVSRHHALPLFATVSCVAAGDAVLAPHRSACAAQSITSTISTRCGAGVDRRRVAITEPERRSLCDVVRHPRPSDLRDRGPSSELRLARPAPCLRADCPWGRRVRPVPTDRPAGLRCCRRSGRRRQRR